MLFFFVMSFLSVVFSAQPALAHDAPEIAPVRLDFDASQAPKNCNDDAKFRNLLANWVLPDMLSVEADRQLIVRIRRSATGGKSADVKLVDAAGETIRENHDQYGVKAECHFVLYDTAFASAKLLGAFDKPPPSPPIVCPACPPPPAPAKPEPCPTCPPPMPLVPRIEPPQPFTRRGFIAAGVSLGTGITPVGAVGPFVAFGIVLSPQLPRIQLEFAGAWAPQTLPKTKTADALHVDMFPLVGSLCYSRYVFRFCSGLVTTFYGVERTDMTPGNDQFRVTLGANVQLGTEFEIHGPLSIRVDGFGRLRFVDRTFGHELAKLDELNTFTAGAIATGVWSFD